MALGIRELTLDAYKIEQVLKYRRASCPKSVLTTFVAILYLSLLADLGLARGKGALETLASYAGALWARHAIFLPWGTTGEGRVTFQINYD